ncbi:bifunctional oligoribonuclease/PAP phosphatase, partial [Rhizobium sp. KAs_5_22]
MSNNTNIYRQIFELIQSYNTIILHRHIHPDPDALGAQGGLQRLIEA